MNHLGASIRNRLCNSGRPDQYRTVCAIQEGLALSFEIRSKISNRLDNMTVQSFAHLIAQKIIPKKKYGIQLMTCSKACHSLLEFFF